MSSALTRLVAAQGWDSDMLLVHDIVSRDQAWQAVHSAGAEPDSIDTDAAALWELRERAAVRQRQFVQRLAATPPLEAQWRAAVLRQQQSCRATDAAAQKVRQGTVSRTLAVRPPDGRRSAEDLANRRLRRPDAGPTGVARAAAETARRDRHIQDLAAMVQEAGLPLAADAAAADDPQRVLRRVGAGRRAETLRVRVAVWKRARRWFLHAFHKPWPTSVADALSYAEAMVAEPCPPSRLVAFAGTLGFLESAGGCR